MKKQRRILLFVYEYPPLGGGVANAIYHLLKEFNKEENLKIDLITSSLNNNWASTQFSKNISCYQVPIGEKSLDSYQKQTPSNMFAYTRNSLKQALDLMAKNKYNLIHVFGYPSALQAWILNKKFKVPYIVSLRGVDVPGYNPRFSAIDFFYAWFIRILWRNAKNLIINSQKLLDLAKETYSEGDFKIIPNGVNTTLFKPSSKRFDKFTITAGGTIFGKKKGLSYLITAFAQFASNKKDVELLLIGDGDLAGELKKLVKQLGIEDKVKLVGHREQTWLAKNLPKCHLFCLPSLNEGMSNATLEAMASGLPIIITPVGGSDELVKDNGYIVEQKNPNQIAEKLELLYSDKSLLNKMGKKSRQIVETMTWGKVARRYLDIYEN